MKVGKKASRKEEWRKKGNKIEGGSRKIEK